MKLLLDTHIWLWSLDNPAKLNRRVLRELDRAGNEIWLSPISIWEVIILERNGKLRLNDGVGLWIEAAVRNAPMKQAPLTFAVALETRSLELPHRDPADLFLAATAKVYGLTLVTGDSNLLEVAGLPVLSNR